MFAFVTLIPLLALASLFVWFWRCRRARDPYRCWNCGMDLYGKPLHGDAKGRIRCPRCGDELDELPLTIRKF